MAGRTLFNFRVLRCPSCSATLPLESGRDIVQCDYCDAQIEVARSKPAVAHTPSPQDFKAHAASFIAPAASTAAPLRAQPQISSFAWILFSLALTVGIGGFVFWRVASKFEQHGVWDMLSSLRDRGDATGVKTPGVTVPKSSKSSKRRKSANKAAAKPDANDDPVVESPAGDPVADSPADKAEPKPGASKVKKAVVARPAPPAATGPVLGAKAAHAALEGDVRACMREHKVHDMLAYMGNKTVGPVKLLGQSGARVDGVRAKVKGTKLGNCIDRAGAKLRVRAFKSDYVRFSLVNDAVPDPLGHLPEKSDRNKINEIIATADAQVLACAKKHGEEGAREVFYFVIDGPSGKARRVDGGYRSKAFHRCALPFYKKLTFPKVRQWDTKVTKHLQM